MIPPPPIPWTARPAIIVAMSCAKAQIRLPTRKTTFAKTMIDFLPQISLILPHRGIQAAFASRYDDAIHEKPLSEAPNCAAIVGRAVEIIVYKRSTLVKPETRVNKRARTMSKAAKNRAN